MQACKQEFAKTKIVTLSDFEMMASEQTEPAA
jgi:hypothetical protein